MNIKPFINELGVQSREKSIAIEAFLLGFLKGKVVIDVATYHQLPDRQICLTIDNTNTDEYIFIKRNEYDNIIVYHYLKGVYSFYGYDRGFVLYKQKKVINYNHEDLISSSVLLYKDEQVELNIIASYERKNSSNVRGLFFVLDTFQTYTKQDHIYFKQNNQICYVNLDKKIFDPNKAYPSKKNELLGIMREADNYHLQYSEILGETCLNAFSNYTNKSLLETDFVKLRSSDLKSSIDLLLMTLL